MHIPRSNDRWQRIEATADSSFSMIELQSASIIQHNMIVKLIKLKQTHTHAANDFSLMNNFPKLILKRVRKVQRKSQRRGKNGITTHLWLTFQCHTRAQCKWPALGFYLSPQASLLVQSVERARDPLTRSMMLLQLKQRAKEMQFAIFFPSDSAGVKLHIKVWFSTDEYVFEWINPLRDNQRSIGSIEEGCKYQYAVDRSACCIVNCPSAFAFISDACEVRHDATDRVVASSDDSGSDGCQPRQV